MHTSHLSPGRRPRISAYTLLGDPAWIVQSVKSYYDIVEQIYLCYDATGLGWSGQPLCIQECLNALSPTDIDKKLVLLPGNFSNPEKHPMDCETTQRQFGLNAASANADWVLQLDTDEVLADQAEFISCLQAADDQGYNSMDYPARWLFNEPREGSFLELCHPTWKIAAGFPGPVAVKAGTKLRFARQCDQSCYRVDFASRNTDPYRSDDVPVHRAISSRQGIVHYAWVRTEADMQRKSKTSGHARDFNWKKRLMYWRWSRRLPLVASLLAPIPWTPKWGRLRLVGNSSLYPRPRIELVSGYTTVR